MYSLAYEDMAAEEMEGREDGWVTFSKQPYMKSEVARSHFGPHPVGFKAEYVLGHESLSDIPTYQENQQNILWKAGTDVCGCSNTHGVVMQTLILGRDQLHKLESWQPFCKQKEHIPKHMQNAFLPTFSLSKIMSRNIHH